MIEERIAQALDDFPAAGRQQLAGILSAETFTGVISAAQSQSLLAEMACSHEELMLALVLVARAYAYPPISNYNVGAVVHGASGDLIFGANVEFPGLILNMTVHGEQAAITQTLLHGETGIKAIAVNGTPCGHCRQFLAEINDSDLQVLTPQGGIRPISEMLPDAFMPIALGNKTGLLDPIHNNLQMIDAGENSLLAAAFESAQKSYAPYSKNWAGVAVELIDGTIISAPYIESVAFNPSISPLQTVLVAMQMNKRLWQEIKAALLVEAKDSLCSQEPITKALLATIDATLALQVVPI